jgi:hypothetical protein
MAVRQNPTRLAAMLIGRYGEHADRRAMAAAETATRHGDGNNAKAWRDVTGAIRALQGIGSGALHYTGGRAAPRQD